MRDVLRGAATTTAGRKARLISESHPTFWAFWIRNRTRFGPAEVGAISSNRFTNEKGLISTSRRFENPTSVPMPISRSRSPISKRYDATHPQARNRTLRLWYSPAARPNQPGQFDRNVGLLATSRHSCAKRRLGWELCASRPTPQQGPSPLALSLAVSAPREHAPPQPGSIRPPRSHLIAAA